MAPRLHQTAVAGLAIFAAIATAWTVPHHHSEPPRGHTRSSTTNSTANSTELLTWWHNTGEVNTQTPVQDGNVRQSHLFNVQVATSSTSEFYDSFAYESIPRNGNGNICVPGDLSSVCNVDDQITIEPEVGVTMAWSQYLASGDSVVSVTRTDGGSTAPDNVVIRPTTLGFDLESDGDALLISIPYSATGYRFSVEFQDDLWQYRNAGPGINSNYVQDTNPSGDYYVSSYTDDMPIDGVEPLNALLIFVSPFPTADLVPGSGDDIYYVEQGLVSSLTDVTNEVVYFAPGVYWFTGTNHALLSDSVSWVYLAPGAYLKGAVEYQSPSLDLRATGFGVVSGEQYVYQANTADGYQNVKSDASSLHMWRGESSPGMVWTAQGLTTANPPFNTMDFYSDDNAFQVQCWDWKHVGAFFGQTDGMEIYPGSHYHDIFYHCGDDTIKTYYSNVLVERVTVWKTDNSPIVQFGWYPRATSNVTVDSVDIIHTRYISQASEYPRALVGSAASYLNLDSTSTANISLDLSDYTVSNWRCEGICPALLGINPLQNIDTMLLTNIMIEQLANDTTQVDMSTFTVYTDSNNNNSPISLGANSPNGIGLTIQNYYVGTEKITIAAGNWDSYSLGRLNIDGSYWGHWETI